VTQSEQYGTLKGSKALVIPLGIEREGCKVALAAIFVSVAKPAGFK
jgi:hypothetical protein